MILTPIAQNRIIDSTNIYNGLDNGKDLLRKKLGNYYTISNGMVVTTSSVNQNYVVSYGQVTKDDTGILPIYRQTITINSSSFYSGDTDQFRSSIMEGGVMNIPSFIDHYFNFNYPTIQATPTNNFQFYRYELLTSNLQTKQIYNVYNDDRVVNPSPNAGPELKDFPTTVNEVENYTFTGAETLGKTNIFLTDSTKRINPLSKLSLNCYIDHDFTTPDGLNQDGDPIPLGTFNSLFDNNKLTNKFFSYFKRTSAVPLSFYVDRSKTLVDVSIRGVLDFFTDYDTINFSSNGDETFYKDFDEATEFESQYLYFSAFSDIRKLADAYCRKSFQEMFIDNKTASHMIIGYKVEKYDLNGKTPLQTFYMMGPVIGKMTDTMLSFGKVYEYKYSAIVMIFGNDYRYTNESYDRQTSTLTFDLVNQPSIQIAEIPVFEKRTVCIDIPNPVPEIEFFNRRGEKNNLIISFKTNENVHLSSPNNYPLLFQKDYETVQKVYYQQDDPNIEFNNMYKSNIFDIYRIDFEKPLNFIQFEENFLTQIGERGSLNMNNIFVDKIAPGQKYYYLFRGVSNFGVPTNFTKIFEVELIQDSDETYIKYDTFEFEYDSGYSQNKQFKKYVSIKTNYQHVATNLNEIGVNDTDLITRNSIGLATPSIWGKTFKVRLISKKTGKKIDINLTYNLKDENSP